jgi:hypothetical protein
VRKELRYSYAHLQRATGIPSSTIRNWCAADHVGTKWDTLINTNERVRQELKSSEVPVIKKVYNFTGEYAKLYSALIYWCEGSKYPASNAVTLVNSDPNLLRFFITLLRRAFTLDESKFKVHLQIHTTHSYVKTSRYWSKLLQIPVRQFIKPTTTSPKGKKHRVHYFGTCTLKYQDYRLLLKLMGIYEGLINIYSLN